MQCRDESIAISIKNIAFKILYSLLLHLYQPYNFLLEIIHVIIHIKRNIVNTETPQWKRGLQSRIVNGSNTFRFRNHLLFTTNYQPSTIDQQPHPPSLILQKKYLALASPDP